jgi:hypothetical protein
MEYFHRDFIQFSPESGRAIANLEMAHHQWTDSRQELEALPVSMYWQAKDGQDYLAVKQHSSDSGTTVGVRSPQLEAQLLAFTERKDALKARIALTDPLIRDRAAQYRALRLPALPDRQAEILRKLDIEGLLGNDLLVVGTNAFAAYELACQAKFPVGNEETEDFDLAWCQNTRVSLASAAPTQTQAKRPSLFSVLRSIDATYRINPKKPYQAVNDAGYEVELLAAPSTHPLPKGSGFDPMASLTEQEWLLCGQPLSCVVATVRMRACPLYVPDPRWMALHKLWLSQKPKRDRNKKPKDERQGNVLLDATRYFLADSHPLDIDFVLSLPDDLRDIFNAWATSRQFDHTVP